MDRKTERGRKEEREGGRKREREGEIERERGWANILNSVTKR